MRHSDAYMHRYGDRVALHVENTLLRMHFCKTTALGVHKYRCDPCNYEETTFNSCGDRHCPQCSGAKRRDWLDRTIELTRPPATYFQLVFTLPDKLSSLILGNRKKLYDLLLSSAWESLSKKMERELGIQSAGLAVLHTWNQRLEHHPHVHMMVPGSGPSLDGTRWIDCKKTRDRKTGKWKPFLVDNKELGREFKALFLRKLKKLSRRGDLEIDEPGWVPDLLSELEDQDWNVFIEGPPKSDMPPSQMLKYLTRYLTGGPISDKRIITEKEGLVHFSARSRKKDGKQGTVKIPGHEFVRRWSLHILPKDFTKVRRYGMWSGNKKKCYLELCTKLAVEQPNKPLVENVKSSNESVRPDRHCPHCERTMECILREQRPRWRDLFYGPDHPEWFEYTSKGECSPSPEGQVYEPEPEPPDIFDLIIRSQETDP